MSLKLNKSTQVWTQVVSRLDGKSVQYQKNLRGQGQNVVLVVVENYNPPHLDFVVKFTNMVVTVNEDFPAFCKGFPGVSTKNGQTCTQFERIGPLTCRVASCVFDLRGVTGNSAGNSTMTSMNSTFDEGN